MGQGPSRSRGFPDLGLGMGQTLGSKHVGGGVSDTLRRVITGDSVAPANAGRVAGLGPDVNFVGPILETPENVERVVVYVSLPVAGVWAFRWVATATPGDGDTFTLRCPGPTGSILVRDALADTGVNSSGSWVTYQNAVDLPFEAYVNTSTLIDMTLEITAYLLGQLGDRLG